MPVQVPGTVAGALAARRLGTPSVAGFALTAAAPFMVVGGLVTTAWAVTGSPAVPVALLVMAAVLYLFCEGYVVFTRYVSNAGSLYTYVAHGLGPRAGVVAALPQLLAYSLLQLGLYGIAGVQTRALVHDATGFDAPWWLWALAACGCVAVLGTRGVTVSSRLLAAAIAVELLIVVVVSVVDLAHPAGGRVTFSAFDPRGLNVHTLGPALAIAATCFVGVEAAPVYSEETRRPRRTLRLATRAALGVMVATYVLGTWAMTVIVGPDKVVSTAVALGPDMLLVPASAYVGGHALVDVGHVLLLTSVAAGLLSYHNAVARCAFALGRDRVLPAAFGLTSPATNAPVVASLAQTLCGLVTIVVFAAVGWDPMTRLFFALGTTGALGVLVLLAAVAVATVRFFARDRRGEHRWTVLVAPALAAVGLSASVALIVANYGALIGVGSGSPLRWLLPAGYLLAAAAGVGLVGVLARRRPGALRAVGRTVNASIGILPASVLGGAR